MKPKLLFPIALGVLAAVSLVRQSTTAGPDAGSGNGHAFAVTSGNIDAVLASENPVLIDFWAEWCGPCRMIAPHVESVAAKYKGRAVVGKVDVDREPELARRYGVQGIPNLKIIKGGKVVDEILGYLPEEELAARLEKHLAAAPPSAP